MFTSTTVTYPGLAATVRDDTHRFVEQRRLARMVRTGPSTARGGRARRLVATATASILAIGLLFGGISTIADDSQPDSIRHVCRTRC